MDCVKSDCLFFLLTSEMHVLEIVTVVGTLILPPSSGLCPIIHGGRHQQSLSPKYRYSESCAITYPRPRHCPLWAVAENPITAETNKADGTDIPTSRCAPLSSTVMSGPGEKNFSSSIGLAAQQDFFRVGENLVVEYNLFSQTLSNVEGACSDGFVSNGVTVKNESGANLDELNDAENIEDSSNDDDYDKFTIRSAMANSVLLHAIKSSTSTGRSSRTKAHVVHKSRRGGRDQGVGAVARVLGTVRIAAAAAASVSGQTKSLENEDGQSDGSSAHVSNNWTSGNSPTAKTLTHKWKNAVQSIVADMLSTQDAFIQQQSVDVASCTESPNTSPPPGTASMGILGEVVQEQFPDIPPLPGVVLVGAAGESGRSQVTVRSSIPHSSDDAHIANLRLSVFSQFDKEQQRNFRNRSVEVLNLRRRKGAVVLVAGESRGENTRDHPYLNEMHSRIEKGHEYGIHQFTTHSLFDTPSPSLTIRPGRGVTVDSSGVAVDASTPKIDGGTIIGSVECSHQEFRGTMLGNSRPPGSLMYVTEVAVRANARRCGAGAMLMRGVDEVAALRNVESVYLHVDVTNLAACAMYEKCGYRHLDKRMPIYAQFTASLNLHDLATHGRKHYLMCKDLIERTTWLEDDESRWDDCFTEN